MKKVLDVVLSAVHMAVAWGILFGSQLISQTIAITLFRGNIIALYIVYSILYVLLTLLLVALYARVTERVSCSELGLTPKLPGLRWLLVGLALPLCVTAFYLLFADGQFIHASSEVGLVLASVTLTSFVAGPTEEALFRGLLMRLLMKKWGKLAAILVPSFMFAAVHIIMMPSVNLISYLLLLVSGTLVGVMFSLIALEGGSIWASSLVHSLWNVTIIGGILAIHTPGSGVTEMALYEYELTSNQLLLSGGNYGIECSLPAMIGFVIVSAYALKRMQKNKNPVF